jgi:AcrR family transcriptional regulator
MATELTGRHRPPLTRDRVLRAGLAYVDEHGLAALSMHKLGAALGVRGMSLYNHVADKDALLDGIVGLLWEEAETAVPAGGEWRERLRALAVAVRAVVHRHPRAGSLPMVRAVMPESMLRAYRVVLAAATDAGVPERRAVEILRAVVGHAFGFALTELCWMCALKDESELQRMRRVSRMLATDLPDDLARVAMAVCGECDMDAQFATGIDLMLSAPAEA